MRLCIADLDHTSVSSAFVKFVERPSLRGMIFVSLAESAQSAEAKMGSHAAEAAVIIRTGFAESLKTNSPVPAEILAARAEQFALQMTRALLRD